MNTFFNKIDNKILLLLLLFISIRVFSLIFFGYIQEDAFIYLRIAENLSRHGEYAYNLGENVSAATSHIYLALMALVSRFSEYKSTFIVMSIINSILQFISVLVWGKILIKNHIDLNRYLLIMTFIPISITVSNLGMETSLLIFIFSVGFYLVKKDYLKSLFLILLVLPLIRPDAIFFSLLLSFSYFLYNKKQFKNTLLLLFASCLGLVFLIIINYLIFNVAINQTIIAKQVAYNLSYAPIDIYNRVINNFANTFALIQLKYFKHPIILLSFFMIFIYSLKKILQKNNDKILVFFIFSVSIILPIIYGIKTNTFGWYLMPSIFMIYISIVFILNNIILSKYRYILILLILIMFMLELISLKNITVKEKYRVEIGKYINSITKKDATLFLEPIGYIPYFAKRYVYCEVGLVTPPITEYRKKYGNENFHKYFLQDKKPTIIVSRADLFNANRGKIAWEWPSINSIWMKDNYELKKHFIYRERNLNDLNSFEIFLSKYGNVSDFYIYKKREEK